MSDESVISPLAALKKLVIAQKSAALPDNPPSPELARLHKALAQYDQFVSEMVIRTLGGGKAAHAYPGNSDLQSEFDQLAGLQDVKPQHINLYRRYQERLDKMLAAAIAASQS